MVLTTRRKIFWAVIALLAGSLSAGAAEIQLRPQAHVRGSLILLGDLAEIRGADAEQADALGRIELFPAPARGRVRIVPAVEIRQLLHLHGVPVGGHRFTGAELVRIAHQQAPADPPAGSVLSSGEPSRPEIIVAKRPIAQGSVIRANDVELQRVGPASVGPDIASQPEAVIGLEARRPFSAGQPIDLGSLQKPILVRRGEMVVVVAKAVGVRVRTTAKALATATLGDLLPVESLDDRQQFTAVVTGPREAEVYAAGATVGDDQTQVSTRPGVRR